MNQKVRELIALASRRLESEKIPGVEARYLAEYVLSYSFTELISHYEDFVDEEKEKQFIELLNKRLTHYPLQYITGTSVFYGLEFMVNEHVLIPRPETERLVETGMDYIRKIIAQGKQDITIVDMCSGSGCIAITLSKLVNDEFPGFPISIIGADISSEALKLANKNKEKLGQENVQFIHSDLFANIENKNVDLLISNPPYITPNDIEELMPEVKDYEPYIALEGGNDGLKFYRLITEESKQRLKEGGMLLFEIGHGQMEDVKNIMSQNMFKGVSGHMDLQDLERIVFGIKLNKPD